MIIREGENCWLNPPAERVSFLVDAADYFEAFVRAVREARQTIYIAGWDFDSRLELDRRGKLADKVPPLGEFLVQMVERNPALHVYLLGWDYHLIYLPERELWPTFQFGWKGHRRIHFHLDDQHPVGASHHQKLVVIDDQIAFCGGLDLTGRRWDTSAHRPDDSRRTKSDDGPYAPFHDVQMAVGGETARALGRLFRYRWRCATGKEPLAPTNRRKAQWPPALQVDIEQCAVAVARTQPTFKAHPGVREIERLYLDAIGAASRWIYIENQYLTAATICRQLGRRLAEPQGPEIVVIMPSKADGWLERSTMDAIRRRNLELLSEQDRNGRLRVYWPAVGPAALPVYVHSKVLIVDRRLVIVGSANLSNRSMGFDSECCLAVEDGSDGRTAAAIDRFRHRLLAEHLGTTGEQVAAVCQHEGSLIRAIDRLGRFDRRLKALDMEAAPVVDGTAWVPDESFLDPEEPFAFDRVIDRIAQDAHPRAENIPLIQMATVVVVLLGLAAVWRWTPLAGWMSAYRLAQWAGLMQNTPLLLLSVIGCYVVGGLLLVPVTLLIAATALILPTWPSLLCAMAGSLLSAWSTYWIGRAVGKSTLRRFTSKRLGRLIQYLSRRGVLAIMMVHTLPVAPFTVVNIAAGTMHIRQGHFLIGTFLGMLPGILALTLFTSGVLQAFRHPTWSNILVAAVVAAVFGGGVWWMHKRMKGGS